VFGYGNPNQGWLGFRGRVVLKIGVRKVNPLEHLILRFQNVGFLPFPEGHLRGTFGTPTSYFTRLPIPHIFCHTHRMRHLTVVLFLTITLTLAGCAESRMKTWIGGNEGNLLANWGAPDRTARAGGKTIYTWHRKNLQGGTVCTQTFVINAGGTIESYSNNCL